MNLYGIYKRNTIDDIPEMNALLDEAHARNDFNVMFKGKAYVITEITRLYRK